MNPNADPRLDSLKHWLSAIAHEHRLDLASLRPASSDASFRRYFRLESRYGSSIVMDAPPAQEDCRPFLQMSRKLQQAGVRVPQIFAQDIEQGFLLMSDLGSQTYYQAICTGLEDATLQALYRTAIKALVQLQFTDRSGLACFDAQLLEAELTLFPQWYVQTHCKAQLSESEQTSLQTLFRTLATEAASQPVVLVHRDFHSPNLMVSQDADSLPGVIDFQDALAGPITYDIASLVMDARTTWDEAQQLDWAIRYWQAAQQAGLPVQDDFAAFHKAYEWMSLQRNLRILGVFSRLSHRDGKHHYLEHIPRVKQYVRQVAGRYGVFSPIVRLLDRLDNNQISYGYTF